MQIQIPDELGAWLQQMATKSGKDAQDYASEALRQHLEDREDYERAVEVSRRVGSGEEKTYSLEEVERRLGLDD
jgi:RHH-type rel operon transcriptional repressor/antitoxin RelB